MTQKEKRVKLTGHAREFNFRLRWWMSIHNISFSYVGKKIVKKKFLSDEKMTINGNKICVALLYVPYIFRDHR